MRCMKGRPGEITLQANCKDPMRDWRSHKTQALFEDHVESRVRVHINLSSGSQACIWTQSSVIPINSRTWVGRKVLFGARRMFNSVKRVRILHRAVAQREEAGG